MSRRTPALATTLLLLLATGCGKSGSGTTSTARTATATSTATAPAATTGTGCTPAKPVNKGAQHVPKPTKLLPAGKPATLALVTNCGEIDIALDVKRAPRTASSVAYLARRGFYDGLSFHRIAKLPTGGDFVIQGGDPTGTGNGGPGYSIVEKPPAGLRYTRGVVAMAKTATQPAGSAGSQFFVVTAADAGLPPEYALLGHVVSGEDVVQSIGELGDASQRPTKRVVVESVTIEEKPAG
jgi:peptidyl-prolyl cis-trans isomerase B (cyclophilin B)